MKFSRGVEALLANLRKTALDSKRRAMVEELEPRRMLSVSADLTGDGRVDEGQAYTLGLSGSASGDTPTLDHWSIDWGDGSSPQTISGSDTTATHVYSDGSTSFQISAYLIASGTLTGGTYGTYEYATYATATASTTVAISDVPLSGSVWQVYTAYERNTLTLGRSYTDVAADPATKWIIDWGDGSGSSHGSHFGEEITGNPSQFKHVYASAGTYSLVATVFNKDQDGYTVSELSMVVNPLDYVVAIDDNGGIMSENEGTLDFTVRRTLPADQVETSPYSIYVHVKTSGIDDEIHNSADDTDYAVVMNDNIEDEGDGFYKITFDPNVDTATLSIIGTDDSDVETQEWFKVVITSVDASGHTPSVDEDHSQAFGGIDDDEQVVSIAIDDGLVSEDANTGRFVVSRGPDSSAELDVPITFTGAAVKGTDYTTSLSGGSSPYVHFDEDETVVIFSITPIDDATAEDPEDVVATLGTPGGDDLYTVDPWSDSASAIITDEVLEAPPSPTNLVAVPLSRDTVRLVWDQPGGDGYPDGFVIQVSTDDGETFAPYDQVFDPTARTLDVSGLDPETTYAFRVDAGIDDLDGNMLDDEDDILTAGDSSEEATTTNDQWVDLGEITPTNIHSSTSFTYFNDGEELPAGDYRFLYVGGAINYDYEEMNGPEWIADEYYTVSNDDLLTEQLQPYDGLTFRSTPEEAAHDALSLVWNIYHSGGTLGMAIYTDDAWLAGPGVTWELQRMPMMTITADDDQASEDGDTAQFTVTREGDATDEADVPITFSGDATFGDDYTTDLDGGSEPFVHFDAGESEKTFSLTPIEDENGEDAEDVIATISPPTGYGTGDPASATATITDLPIVWVTVGDDSMMEPDAVDTGTFTIHRSSGIGSLDVNYVLGGTADLADDYTIDGDPEEQTVSMEEGVTSVDVTLDPCGDNVVEGDETAEPSVDTSQSGCATSSGLSLAAQAAMPVAGEITLVDKNSPDDSYVDLDLDDTPDATEATVGGYVALNADNDNESVVTNHIPEHYDFEIPGGDYLEPGENDLVALTLAKPGSFDPNTGDVTLTWSNGDNAMIKVWEEMNKITEVTSGETFTLTGSPKVVYVEGIQVSKDLDDKVTFTLTDEGENSDTVVARITPILSKLQASVNKVNNKNPTAVTKTIGDNWARYFLDGGLVGKSTMEYYAEAFHKSSPGELHLLMDISLDNVLIAGGAGGKTERADGTKKVGRVVFGTAQGTPQFPYQGKTLLDVNADGRTETQKSNYSPFIPEDEATYLPFIDVGYEGGSSDSTGETAWAIADDSPNLYLGNAGDVVSQWMIPDAGKTSNIGVTYHYTFYAAWWYPAEDGKDSVMYFFGKNHYDFKFNGTVKTDQANGKITVDNDNSAIDNTSAFQVINNSPLPDAYTFPSANTVFYSWQFAKA